TVIVARVRSAAVASRSTRTSSFSPVTWKAKRAGRSDAVTTTVPAASGLRRSVGSLPAVTSQRAAGGGRGRVTRAHWPACPGAGAAAVRLHAGDAGPPVGQMEGLAEEVPDVRPGSEELARGGYPHRRRCRPSGE